MELARILVFQGSTAVGRSSRFAAAVPCDRWNSSERTLRVVLILYPAPFAPLKLVPDAPETNRPIVGAAVTDKIIHAKTAYRTTISHSVPVIATLVKKI
jgi:hypothetical protein